MASRARETGSYDEGDTGEAREPTVQDLMDPAALETRLAAARARRAEVLAQKGKTETPRRQGRMSPPGPADLPPEALLPLHESPVAAPPRGQAQQTLPSGQLAQAGTEARAERAMPVPVVTAPPQRLLEPAERAEGAAPRARRRWVLPALFLAAGVMAGVGGVSVLLGVQGWQVVLLPPEGEAPRAPQDAEPVATPTEPTVTASPANPPATPESEASSPDPEGSSMPDGVWTPRISLDAPASGESGTEGLAPVSRDVDATAAASLPPPAAPERALASGAPLQPAIGPRATSVTLSPLSGEGAAPLPAETAAATELPEQPALPTPPTASDTLARLSPLPLPEPQTAAPADDAATPLSGVQLVLHHPPDAAATAAAASEAFAAADLGGPTPREVGFSISEPNVRYYYESEREAALEIASVLSAALDADVRTRSFTDFEPRPAQGLVEVWLAGTAPPPEGATQSADAAAAPAAAAPSDIGAAERERLIQAIETRLRQRLQ